MRARSAADRLAQRLGGRVAVEKVEDGRFEVRHFGDTAPSETNGHRPWFRSGDDAADGEAGHGQRGDPIGVALHEDGGGHHRVVGADGTSRALDHLSEPRAVGHEVLARQPQPVLHGSGVGPGRVHSTGPMSAFR